MRISLRRCLRLGLLVVASLALAVPVAFAKAPGGNGLYGEHVSHCTGTALPGGVYDGAVLLLPEKAAGSTFWANGVHLVIQSALITPDDGSTPFTVTIGNGLKTGHAAMPTVVCQGHFDGYTVRSTSIPMP